MSEPTVYTPPNAPVEKQPASQALSVAEKQSIRMSIDTVLGFESMQRLASALASSDIVPDAYRGKVGNCFVAIDIALRLRMSPVQVMQNLYLVKGKASWSGSFAIAVVNGSGRFAPMEWEWRGQKGQKEWGCRAVSQELTTKKVRPGQWVDWALVQAEGWDSKDGSKWRSMPEQMFVYRAASFWLKQWYPEGLQGLSTKEEAEDAEVIDVTPRPTPVAPEALPPAAAEAPAPPQVDPPAPKEEPPSTPPPAAPARKARGPNAIRERIEQAQKTLTIQDNVQGTTTQTPIGSDGPGEEPEPGSEG